MPEQVNKNQILSQEIERLNALLEQKNKEIGNLNRKMKEIEEMTQTIGSLQSKITKLVNENTVMGNEVNEAQENLRLSANQNKKFMNEIR